MKLNLPFKSKSSPMPPSEVGEDFGEGFWQISFLDTITVLLCMMILLASIPSNSKTSDQSGDGEFPLEVDWDIFRLNEELKLQLRDELDAQRVLLEKGEYEIRMIFTGSSFYNQGSTELLPEGQEIIQGIVEKLVTWNRQDYKIDVEGHTDSTPINTFQFPSNWELSAARASGVVKFFLDSGVPAFKLKASGYADSSPLYSELDDSGQVIPGNQDFNRRIVIRLYFE